ncbi:MAG: ABC transporter substrate-binding protein [Lachnospiraceae bacterium]|nr:ABC transporter substrate-binding protein [Lachnospiraceae bacterium]
MKKKSLSMILAMAMAVSLCTGCGSAAAPAPEAEKTTETKAEQPAAESTAETVQEEASASIVTEPTELTFIFADGDEGMKEAMNTIVKNFNEAYEDITVTIEPGNGGAYSEFLKTKDSVGEFPDIMEMRDTAMYVRAGKLAELPSDITSLFASTTEFNGKVYTAAMGGENTDGIYYNKAYFDANGFTEPATYDEFIALCQAIKDKGDMAPLVVGGQDIWHLGFLFNKAYDDQVISQDEEFISHCYDGSADFANDGFKKTFEEMAEIMAYAQDGWTSTPDAQITTFLVNDMAAMLFSGTHMIKTIKEADPDFELGWFAVPSPDGKLRLVGGSGIGGLAISAEAAQDANKKAAAEEFIRYFFSADTYKYYCETMNCLPTLAEAPALDVDPVMQEIIEATQAADHLSPMWNGKTGNNELPPDFRNFTYKTCIEYLQGTTTLDAALEELNKTWQTSIASFNPVTGVGIVVAE